MVEAKDDQQGPMIGWGMGNGPEADRPWMSALP